MVDGFKKEQIRTAILIAIGFAILLFILLKEHYFFEAKVYGGMGILTIFILLTFKFFWKHSPKEESLEESYVGVSKHPIKGILIGLAFAVAFILLTKVKFFGSVAQLITPQIPLSVSASAIVIILLAPIFEEFAFTSSIGSFLDLYLPFWLVAIIKGAFFSSVHFWAYVIVAGSTLSNALGSFIGAGIFGFLSMYLGKYFGVEASQSGHFGFNGYNFNNMYHLFSVVG